MTQLLLTNLDEDILVARLKLIREQFEELRDDVETRRLAKDVILEKIRGIEKGLRKTREGI